MPSELSPEEQVILANLQAAHLNLVYAGLQLRTALAHAKAQMAAIEATHAVIERVSSCKG